MTILPLDQEAGGGGARTDMDGIDAGSNIHSISNAIPNVERNEDVYPILQVWRRLVRDSAGPGKWRGGAGVEILYVPHGMKPPVRDFVFSSGDDQPGAMGIHGGYPGSIQRHIVLRNSNLWALFAQGTVPSAVEELAADRYEVLPAKGSTTLAHDDVHWSFMAGGGGYGDPLERDPSLVAEDIRLGLVSPEQALRIYGFSDPPNKDRDALRARRLAESAAPAGPVERVKPASRIMPGTLGDCIALVEVAGTVHAACRACGAIFGPLPRDPKRGCARRLLKLSAVTPLNAYAREDLFEFREYLCPGCGRLVGVQVAPVGETDIFDDTMVTKPSGA
jgi:N-methylhydantoinase B